MNLTREDLLRELELLPVWQLRTPAAAPAAVTEPQVVAEKLLGTNHAEQAAIEPVVEATQLTPEAPVALNLQLILSDDSQYLFLLESLQTADEATLLQNMFKAMQINHMQTNGGKAIGLQNMADLSAHSAKIIIAMGQAAAQALGLAADSGIQQTAFGAAIATFSPAHLLQHPQDKAQAWQHLCEAKLTIQAL